MKKIVVLNHHAKSITGGHMYNDKLYDYLSEISNYPLVYEPDLLGRYIGWRKLLGPIIELKRLKRIAKGDVVFFIDSSLIYHFLLLLCCRFFKKSYNICIVHHFAYLQYAGLKRRVLKKCTSWYCKLSNTVIVPSPYTKQIAEETLGNVFYIPLPFNNNFKPSSNYNDGDLLFVGGVEQRKGLSYLLKALKILKEKNIQFRLNIVGAVKDEKTYMELKDDIVSYNLSNCVFFRGRVSEKELQNYYGSSELFVFPSLLEGYGMVFVEAMNYGLPIVCFNNSAMPFSIKNGVNGYLADNLDVVDFASKIEIILHNKKERQRLQQGIEEILSEVKTEADFKNAVESFYVNYLT